MTVGAAGSRPLTADILAVGSELLTPFRLDTNSLLVTECLNDLGIEVRAKTVVGDEARELGARLDVALARADIVVLTGGLGPTEDDITREAVASVLDLPLEEHPDLVAHVEARFAARGLTMPASNRRQAQVPRGAVRLDNPHGTAPGLWIEQAGRVVILLPGPPRELKPMLQAVRGLLAARAGTARLFRRTLRVTGLSESHVDEAAKPVYARWLAAPTPVACTILAVQGQIELHLSTRDEDADRAAGRLDEMTAELQSALSPAVYSVDGRMLEEVVGDLLRARRLWIAVAESCTGGLLASRLTDVSGSSDYFERGVVCYSNRAKVELLKVPESLILQHGAVSEPVAGAMARGVRVLAGTDLGIGITGIAGPSGGSEDKPVGTVYVALADAAGAHVNRHRFLGPRALVKYQAAQAALDLVRRRVLQHDGD